MKGCTLFNDFCSIGKLVLSNDVVNHPFIVYGTTVIKTTPLYLRKQSGKRTVENHHNLY